MALANVTKAFTLGARVTIAPSADRLRQFRESVLALISADTDNKTKAAFVVLNGEILGSTELPDMVVESIRRLDALGETPHGRGIPSNRIDSTQ